MNVGTYADALYHVKRGFLIIGLTGFTASGCSTVMRLLSRTEKPEIPEYEAVSSRTRHPLDDRICRKLTRVWNDLDWVPFVPIEVSKVIYALAVSRATRFKQRDETLNVIRGILSKDRHKLLALRYLQNSKRLSPSIAESVIEAYKICAATYSQFKSHTGKDLGQFIQLMQDFGDDLRKYGRVLPTKNMRSSPQHLFVLPEAIRRLVKAYRVAKGASHFVIDAFRNPYEVEYFKRRYSEFYLVAVLRDERDRDKTLLRSLSHTSLQRLKTREEGQFVERRKDNIGEWVTSQNLEECLQKADIFIENTSDSTKTYPHLRFNLIKLIALAKNPGSIPPSTDERSMQIAMTARQMSGCVSRQVCPFGKHEQTQESLGGVARPESGVP